jgi:hypothetical protein
MAGRIEALDEIVPIALRYVAEMTASRHLIVERLRQDAAIGAAKAIGAYFAESSARLDLACRRRSSLHCLSVSSLIAGGERSRLKPSGQGAACALMSDFDFGWI